MNKFFRTLPLMVKLLVIAIVPLVFIGFLTIDLYNEKAANLALAQRYLTRINQSIFLTRLAGELQKERRYSFIYALKKGNRKEMMTQRSNVNIIFQNLKKEQDETLRDFTSYTDLDRLDSVRSQIDNGTYNKDRVMHFYSSAVFRLNTLNKAPVLEDNSLKETNHDLITQQLLAELITYQSIIDANVFNVLFTKQYIPETLLGTYPTWDVYRSYEQEFKIKASPDALARFKQFQQNGALQTVDAYLNHLFSTFQIDSSFSYQTWASTADASLKELRTYQVQLIRKVQTNINNYYEKELRKNSKQSFI